MILGGTETYKMHVRAYSNGVLTFNDSFVTRDIPLNVVQQLPAGNYVFNVTLESLAPNPRYMFYLNIGRASYAIPAKERVYTFNFPVANKFNSEFYYGINLND